MIIGWEGSISPLLVLLTVFLGNGIIIRLIELDDRNVRRGEFFTDFIITFGKGLGGFFIIMSGDNLVTSSIIDLFAAGE